MRNMICISLFLATSVMTFGQANDQCGDAREARRPVVEAFRLINTVEVSFHRVNNRYGNISELMNSPEMKRASERMGGAGNQTVSLGSSDDPLPGYTLRLIVAADGKSYAVTASKKSEPCRGWGGATESAVSFT
jgi:alkylated DNA nucleotide flippase Atl1